MDHRKKSNCPYCSGKRILPGFNDLPTVNPLLAREWDNKKNNIDVSAVSPFSHSKAWWRCAKNHSWEAQIKSRHMSKRGCPVCSNKLLVVGVNDFGTTHKELAKEWHPTKNGELLPKDFFGGSKQKVWWKGSLCGHEWETQILSRTRGGGCPICSGRKILVGFNDFASSSLPFVGEWHPLLNLPLTAEGITIASGKKFGGSVYAIQTMCGVCE